ncbi:MAG: thermonuclease family protein [Patescibacteria group bacterium]|nr:thermonuclease family protein [Patescibacteria group bacterium]
MGKIIDFFKKNINWILVIFLFLGFVFFKKNLFIKKNTSILIPTLISTSTPIPILTSKQIQNQTFYSVAKVVDGDTIEIEIDGKIQRIRIIGINTPEVVDPRKPVECFGKEASEKAKELLSGKKIRLEKDPTQGDIDKYARLLRYVFLEDGTDFGLTMIKEGYAYEYTYNIPYKYQQQYKQAQKEAEKNKKGLWADGVCVTPTNIKILAPNQFSINHNDTLNNQLIPTIETETTNQKSSFFCNCSKTCSQISSCEEAYFQLNNCGCKERDADNDGVPCESLCR